MSKKGTDEKVRPCSITETNVDEAFKHAKKKEVSGEYKRQGIISSIYDNIYVGIIYVVQKLIENDTHSRRCNLHKPHPHSVKLPFCILCVHITHTEDERKVQSTYEGNVPHNRENG